LGDYEKLMVMTCQSCHQVYLILRQAVH